MLILLTFSSKVSLINISYSGVPTLGIALFKSFLISLRTSLSARSFKLTGFCSIKFWTLSTIVEITPSSKGTLKLLKTLGPSAKSCVVSIGVSAISLASLVSIVVVFFVFSALTANFLAATFLPKPTLAIINSPRPFGPITLPSFLLAAGSKLIKRSVTASIVSWVFSGLICKLLI